MVCVDHLAALGALGALGRFRKALLNSVAMTTTPMFDFVSDGDATPAQDMGNLQERLLGSLESAELESFILTEVLFHWRSSMWRLKRLLCSRNFSYPSRS
jgi:hypothetical protein